MTKLVKLSLAAAIAVSGLSSTVAAKPLEEAIKGIDISGTITYRYDDRSESDDGASDANDGDSFNPQDKSTDSTNSYKAIFNVKVPVNDMVTMNASVIAGQDVVVRDTQEQSDADPTFDLETVNFTAKMGMLSVTAGKQGIATPYTVAQDYMGNDQTGTGIVALADAGFATFAAAYFNQQNISNSGDEGGLVNGWRDISALAVIAPLGPVNFDLWYVDAQSLFDTWTLGLSGSAFGISASARYTSLDVDSDFDDVLYRGDDADNDAWEINVSGDLGPVGLAVTYGQTDKDGGLVALDCDATTGMQAWNVNACDKRDADFLSLSANMDLMPGLNLALTYAEVDYDATSYEDDKAGAASTDVDEDEIYATLTYQMSDNFRTYVRYGTYDVDSDDNTDDLDRDRGRLEIRYSF